MPSPTQPQLGHAPHHVQPSSPAHKQSYTWVWIVILVVAVLIYFIAHGHAKPAPARVAPNIAVSTVTAKTGSINVVLDTLGTVTPTYTVTVTSRVSGELTEVHYKEGQLVKKGDLLAVIDPRPYEAAVMQAKGTLDKDVATMKNAQIDLTRYQNAYKEHAITEQQVATQQATVEQDQGQIQVDKANLDVAQLNVEYSKITSPIDGRVGLRMVDPGNLITANGTQGLVTITQLQPITVIFTLAEDEIAEVAEQLNAGKTLQVQALDRTQQHILATGTLITLDNQINATTGTVRARATFANEKLQLYPNQFVNARVRIKTIPNVILVPNTAIQRNSDQTNVYLLVDGKAEMKPVKVTATEGENSAVTGINAGDTLIGDGFDKLQNGSKVVVRGAK